MACLMARYFFHVHDGETMPDPVGRELPNMRAVRIEAVKRVSSLLGDDPERFWNGQDWSLEVRDSQDLILFTLEFVVNSSPAGLLFKESNREDR